MRGDRHVIDGGGNKISLAELARRTRCPFEHEVEVNREGSKEKYVVRLGMRKNIDYEGIKLDIIIVRGFGEEEMILATNSGKEATEVLEIYLTRWKCEETFRFLKNEYNLEDVRVRSYMAVRNTVAILHAVFYFLSVELSIRIKFSVVFKKIMEKAKRFFEVNIFKNYALADGIEHMLHKTGWEDMYPEIKRQDKQLAFSFGS